MNDQGILIIFLSVFFLGNWKWKLKLVTNKSYFFILRPNSSIKIILKERLEEYLKQR